MNSFITFYLQIGESLGKDLTSIVNIARQNGISSLTTIDSLVKLLQMVPPTAFQSFRSFAAWRSSIAAVLSKSLDYAAKHNWAPRGGETNGSAGSARSLLASLRGSLRRMDVREADDYEEREYAEATKGVAEAAGRLAQNLQSGLNLPLGLAVQVAELLMGGVFDTLEEGAFLPEAQELLGLLSGNVWPQLKISPQMNSALTLWVHFRQYVASKEVSLLQAGASLAKQMNAGVSSPSKRGGSGAAMPSDAAFTTMVLDALSTEAAGELSDYHATFAGGAGMHSLLEFLAVIEHIRGADGSLQKTISKCIETSVGAAFARRAEEVHTQVLLEEDRTALLATSTIALLHVERSKFVPVLRQYQPAASAIAAATLHQLYGAKMLTWLLSVTNLTKSVAATIHASVDLEAELLAEVETFDQEPPPPWSALERVTPLLHTWARAQVSNMYDWLDRIVGKEDWAPVVQQRGATARSAVEVLKVMEDAVHTLFDLGLAVPAGVVRSLMEGMDAVLTKYSKLAVAAIGSADSLVPPAPPLTRYKKDLAEAAESEAMGGSTGIKSVTNKVGAALVSSWLPDITKEEQQRIMPLLYDVLVVRANSMQHIAVRVAEMENVVIRKFEESQEVIGSREVLQPGFLEGAVATAAEATDHILRFITIKLVCGDLRNNIFKDLYSYHVGYYRIQPILEEVDGALGMLCEMLSATLAPRMAGHVCKTLAAAVLHVLLDGGPNRLFTYEDAPALREDYEKLKAMFYAEGAGLDPAAVAKLCGPLEEAIYAMSLDGPSLIKAAKATKKQPLKASAKQGNDANRAGLDPEVVLHVMCHRADYEVSKFLKKE